MALTYHVLVVSRSGEAGLSKLSREVGPHLRRGTCAEPHARRADVVLTTELCGAFRPNDRQWDRLDRTCCRKQSVRNDGSNPSIAMASLTVEFPLKIADGLQILATKYSFTNVLVETAEDMRTRLHFLNRRQARVKARFLHDADVESGRQEWRGGADLQKVAGLDHELAVRGRASRSLRYQDLRVVTHAISQQTLEDSKRPAKREQKVSKKSEQK